MNHQELTEGLERLRALDRSQWSVECRLAYQLGLQDGKKDVFERLNPQITRLQTEASERQWELDIARQSEFESASIERGRWGIFG